MRIVVLTIALIFIGCFGVLTAVDIRRHGVTVPGALAIFVLVLFIVGILGALREPPSK